MFKQLSRVGIQTNFRIFLPANCRTSRIVNRIYTRGAKRDPTPHWENAESLTFIKDFKDARLNAGV